MNRRSNDCNGWVNFPVNDPAWPSSREGGMFVKLVVCDNREFDDKFGICAGVNVYDQLCESLVGDDQRPQPVLDNFEDFDNFAKQRNEWEEYHYPHINHHEITSTAQYTSRGYLCAIVLGSSGWSGYSSEKQQLWHCTYEDLTEQGKALYDQIKQLYPGCDLHLLTFLDT